MTTSMRQLFWIFLTMIGCWVEAAPFEYEGFENEPESSYDFDTEQSQARYDAKVLSAEIRETNPLSEKATSCYVSHIKYEHGQKIIRSDPCEMCLCVDGEIFCWWRKCDFEKRKQHKYKNKHHKIFQHNKKQLVKKNESKFKMMKFIPKQEFHLPEHPSGKHYLDNLKEIARKVKSENLQRNNSRDKILSIEKDTSWKFPLAYQGNNLAKNDTKHRQDNFFKIPLDNRNSNVSSKVNKIDDLKVESINNPENIKKWDEGKIYSASTSNSNNRTESEVNSTKSEQTRLADVPLAKHYIITSSGSVENEDVLANENALSQYHTKHSLVNETMQISSSSGTTMTETVNSKINMVKPYLTTSMDISTKPSTHTSPKVPIQKETIQLAFQKQQRKDEENTSNNHEATSEMITNLVTLKHEAKECIVMGVSYSIGSILPQDTGNCLQCICIEGVNQEEQPRVTCTPHNCPPLILPDIFDTTGY